LPDGAAGDAAGPPLAPSTTATSALPHPPPAIPDHELVRRIGAGAYGEVWLARNTLGAYRAVKVVYRSDFDSDRPYDREFEGIRKAEPVSRTHESQADILHVGRGEGYFYYVMELADDASDRSDGVMESWSDGKPRSPGPSVPHSQTPSLDAFDSGSPHPSTTPLLHYSNRYAPRTLKHDLQVRGRLPPAECVEIGLALATALAHLHQHGLVHRDVKPSNIIFVGGVPKLADIGLVTDADTTFSYVGTEGYVAPEGPGSPQADLYSLGKVLYEISTGKDRKEYPALPPELRSLPDSDQLVELNAVLLKACARDPRERYAGAEALRADLELLQRGRSVRQHRVRQRRWALIRTAGVGATMLAMLGLFGSLLWSTLAHRLRTIPAVPGDRVSVFVLPFRNPTPYLHRPTTNEVANEICARMTDALIDSLAAIDGVRVGPRKSGWIFEPEETLRKRVVQPLFQMDYVVCGHLEITNAMIRGRVELYETRQARLLWSTNTLSATNEVIALEKRLLADLASTLRVSVGTEVQARIDQILANNWAAYRKYLEAQYYSVGHPQPDACDGGVPCGPGAGSALRGRAGGGGRHTATVGGLHRAATTCLARHAHRPAGDSGD
jgi:TolB-like protein